MRELAKSFHPATWWLLGISFSLFATLSHALVFLLASCVLSVALIFVFRDSTLRSKSLGFYLALAGSVVLVRIAFRIIFNQVDLAQQTALALPQISLKFFGLDLDLLGPVSFTNLVNSTTDGLRLAAIILGIAMANTLANPRKLLRSTPSALYEIATAAAVAINLAPQLIESLHRVRRARSLRAPVRGFRSLGGLMIPVLEDALEKSLALAASMDARGFGLQRSAGSKHKVASRSLTILGVVSIAASAALLISSASSQWIALVGFCLGLGLLAVSLKLTGNGQLRTFYRPEKMRTRDFAFIAISIALIATAWVAINA